MHRPNRACFVLALPLWAAPLLGCTEPPPERAPTSEPESHLGPLEDRRPDVRPAEDVEDITDRVRAQNGAGQEPARPIRRGLSAPTGLRPKVELTSSGFVARLPRSTRVATPAYYEGRVYAGGFGSYELHAMEAATGKASWSVHLSDDGPTAPACEEGVCVFNTFSCTMFGLDAETGRQLWSWYLGSPQLATPVVADRVVYTSYPGDGTGPSDAGYVLAAFELQTGRPLWRRWIDSEVNATPVVHAGVVYVATQRGTLYELAASDGAVRAAHKNRVASPPVPTSEGLFFARDNLEPENELVASMHPVFPQLEEERAARPERVTARPRPLVVAQRVITVDDGGVVVATHRKTGRRLWHLRLAGEEPAKVEAPLIYAGGSVLLATQRGNVVRMDSESGEPLSTFELGEGAIASQPIVHGGWIYAGTTEGALVGYDTGEPSLTGWEMLGGGADRRGSVEPEDS